jgi:ribosome biogenesis protein ERB1
MVTKTKASMTAGKRGAENIPELNPASEEEESVYDSDAYDDEDESEEDEGSDEEQDDDGDDDEEEFEDQGSSDEDDDVLDTQKADDDSSEGDVEILDEIEDYEAPRAWKKQPLKRNVLGSTKEKPTAEATWIHTDDLSSDDEDEEGVTNRIGRVPLHWYDEYDHIGYDAHGSKVVKSTGKGDRLDQAIAGVDGVKRFVVHDALNDKEVELSERQLELIRRVQAGAFAHPEFDANPDYIDYYSGVDKQISGLTSGRIEPKSKWQPNAYETMQVQKLLQDLREGKITLDELKGKTKKDDPNREFLLWHGDEEDELAMRKGPQHLPAPKVPPPGHAASYNPPDEYLPTENDLKEWADMPVKDRPNGYLIPKKFPNLRSVGAYQHSVQEVFERCLDLYLCPRSMKRRLNIDPETLVPKPPKAQDLRPFPTAKCIEYNTPFEGDTAPVIRCVSPSPDGQYLASGASDGVVRLWEVQTSRLLRSWDVSSMVSEFGKDGYEEEGVNGPLAVVCIEWNPNKLHQCIAAGVGKCVVLIATGTGNSDQSIVTDALLTAARNGGNVTNVKAAKAVQWKALPRDAGTPISSYARSVGPISALVMSKEVASVRWHKKGDYFVSVSPKAGAAAVLIHQLSKGNSQQPFSKSKGEALLACFHPNKPFLFVASPQHVRVYHLVKQSMVKRLISGCRWISSMDIHPTGDHLIIGSLDRRMIWFDLDLSNTPYKTLKYHERGLRSVGYHTKYPLMASASDDGSVHVFHSMVYSDLMRNPLLVPVKVLRGHSVSNKLGVLSLAFHPTQPWLFTAGADGRIFLYQDI